MHGFVVHAILGTTASSDFSRNIGANFANAYSAPYTAFGRDFVRSPLLHQLSFIAFRFPYAGGFFEAAFSDSSPLPWPSSPYD